MQSDKDPFDFNGLCIITVEESKRLNSCRNLCYHFGKRYGGCRKGEASYHEQYW